jgi:hypothetical protein
MTRATREVSWNGMLIDWEGAGPERRFEVRVLMSWTLLRSLPIPSVVIGHWSSGNLSLSRTYPTWQSIENRTMIVRNEGSLQFSG